MVLLLLALFPLQADEKHTSQDPEIREVLFDYDQVTLAAMLADLQKRSGIPIEMDAAAKKVVDPDTTIFSTKIQDLSLYKCLYMLLRPKGLTVKCPEKKRVLITAEP